LVLTAAAAATATAAATTAPAATATPAATAAPAATTAPAADEHVRSVRLNHGCNTIAESVTAAIRFKVKTAPVGK
jgi:hypothetical protein